MILGRFDDIAFLYFMAGFGSAILHTFCTRHRCGENVLYFSSDLICHLAGVEDQRGVAVLYGVIYI